jgi:hypothetical protein
MTLETDLVFNWKASELADRALAWLAVNHSIAAMDAGSKSITKHDFGDRADRVWYTQRLEGPGIKFGHLVMKPGVLKFAQAAVCDFPRGDGSLYWMLCAVSDHPSSLDAPLAPRVCKTILVHEAAHCLNFTSSGHKPLSFQAHHADDLASYYYNTLHEFNAFFHQGLFLLLADLEMIRSLYCRTRNSGRYARNQFFSRLLYGDGYWPIFFVNGLRGKYNRKFRRRCFNVFDEYLPR